MTVTFSSDTAVYSSGFTGLVSIIDAVCTSNSDCNTGTCTNGSCVCPSRKRGIYCELDSLDGLSPREYHVSAYDSTHDIMYIHGGLGQNLAPLGDLYVYNFTTSFLELISVVGPSPLARFSHYGWVWNASFYILGGFIDNTGNSATDMWKFDLSTSSWTLQPTLTGSDRRPPFIHSPSMVMVPKLTDDGFELYMYGGLLSGYYSSAMYMFDSILKKWSFVDTIQLDTRFGSASYDASRHVLVFMPGDYVQGTAGFYYTIEYSLYSRDWTVRTSEDVGMRRAFTPTSFSNDYLVSFGGQLVSFDSSTVLDTCIDNTLKVFDTACGNWTYVTHLPHLSRKGHSQIVRNNVLYVLGGSNGYLLNDLVVIDLSVVVSNTNQRDVCRSWSVCQYASTCNSCFQIPSCIWCGNVCTFQQGRGLTLNSLPSSSHVANVLSVDTANGQCISNIWTVSSVGHCPAIQALNLSVLYQGSFDYGMFQDVYFPATDSNTDYQFQVLLSNVQPSTAVLTLSILGVQEALLTSNTGSVSVYGYLQNLFNGYTVRLSYGNTVGLSMVSQGFIPSIIDQTPATAHSSISFNIQGAGTDANGIQSDPTNGFLGVPNTVWMVSVLLFAISFTLSGAGWIRRRRMQRWMEMQARIEDESFQGDGVREPPKAFQVVMELHGLCSMSAAMNQSIVNSVASPDIEMKNLQVKQWVFLSHASQYLLNAHLLDPIKK